MERTHQLLIKSMINILRENKLILLINSTLHLLIFRNQYILAWQAAYCTFASGIKVCLSTKQVVRSAHLFSQHKGIELYSNHIRTYQKYKDPGNCYTEVQIAEGSS
ncbi:uncharacterized protein [Elaeis guineensis]|uniref:uncharacterized protein n=1 Tax=Elaeis guineensis var. tenera TaxID=51953 RepID=UPI003C6DA363